MKNLFLLLVACCGMLSTTAQHAENLVIVTTDGFRWQEVFKGMDSAIAQDKRFNQGDSAYLFRTYWDSDVQERRKKLLPFIWGKLALQGRIYGNRMAGNKVDNANKYWFSYPGYNEIFTGYPDDSVNSNDYTFNPNTTVLEYINALPAFKGRVAAFTAWNAFDRILNEPGAGFPVIAAFDTCCAGLHTPAMQLINRMTNDSYRPFGAAECLDVFTHYKAWNYLQVKKPRVLYIAYGETDEWAHAGKYRSYLDAAHQVDNWLRELWDFIQNDPQYRGKTALLVTVDHGRGDRVKEEWTSHNHTIADSHEIWFAVAGPGISSKGEMKAPMQLYQQQLAATIARLLGLQFTAAHPVAAPLPLGGQ